MNNAKTTRRALLTSVVALVICLTMLMGTTFAWFTDTASVNVNKIQSGTLDVMLVDENGNDLEGKPALNFIKADNSTEILWEPGCTYNLPGIRVINNGNLALKYEIVITGIKGDAKLNEVITWTNADGAVLKGELTPKGTEGAQSDLIVISGHMAEDAGNEYQDLTIDGISITVNATQLAYEYDSIDNKYDENATAVSTWNGTADAEGLAANTNDEKKTVEIKTAEQLAAFAAAVNAGNDYAGYTVSLLAPINLAGKDWAPIGATNGETLNSYPTYTFSGTFEGNGMTITGLNVTSAGGNAVAGLFGTANRATIKNVVIDGAVIKSEHYAGGILAYDTEYTNVIGCVVKNSTITSSTNGTGNNGDKAGGIVGCMTGANAAYAIKGNTVSNCVITAYRDCGGIIGMAATGLAVEENTVINTTIAQDLSDNYKLAEDGKTPTTFGEIVGRGNPTLTNNTAKNVTVAGTVKKVTGTVDLVTADEGAVIVGDGETVITNLYQVYGVTVSDCNIVAPVGNAASASQIKGNNTFINCTFTADGTNRSFWADSVADDATITFINCTFTNGIALGGDATNKYTFTNCSFTGAHVWKNTHITAYSPITLDSCTFSADANHTSNVYLSNELSKDIVTVINCTVLVSEGPTSTNRTIHTIVG